MRFNTMIKQVRWIGLSLLLLLAAACGGLEAPTPVSTLALPTQPPALESVATETSPPDPTAVPTSTATEAPTTAPVSSPTATAVPATATPPVSTSNQTSYAVIFVEPNDTLNVRSGPGVDFGIVGTVPPTATDVQITGSGQFVSGSTWVPIQRGGLSGWVNSRFLTQFVPDETFCGDTAVLTLLDRLKTAVANQDDTIFAQLIHPERGLRVHLLWYEAETRLDNQNLFSDATSYNWGAAAGSGKTIIGTPAQILLPPLQADFLDATETACNEILHGGTPGFVVLPDAYTPINYYSFYRPGSDEFAGLNWGSWVVGLELWQGQYYLSTLVHFQWEP
jgi:hypothetical protein